MSNHWLCFSHSFRLMILSMYTLCRFHQYRLPILGGGTHLHKPARICISNNLPMRAFLSHYKASRASRKNAEIVTSLSVWHAHSNQSIGCCEKPAVQWAAHVIQVSWRKLLPATCWRWFAPINKLLVLWGEGLVTVKVETKSVWTTDEFADHLEADTAHLSRRSRWSSSSLAQASWYAPSRGGDMDMQWLTSMHEFMLVADPICSFLSVHWLYVVATRRYSQVVRCTVFSFVIVHKSYYFDPTGLSFTFRWRFNIFYLPDRILCRMIQR